MTSNTWAYRLSQSSARLHRKKSDLLPLPQCIRDILSLEYHLLLEALRAGVGTLAYLQILTRVALATTMLSEEEYGGPIALTLEELEGAAYKSYKAGEKSGSFVFDDKAFCLFAELLTHHDRQLAATPVYAIEAIAQRLGGSARSSAR
jgi:hypothetical protein